jgi:hypothetical protein
LIRPDLRPTNQKLPCLRTSGQSPENLERNPAFYNSPSRAELKPKHVLFSLQNRRRLLLSSILFPFHFSPLDTSFCRPRQLPATRQYARLPLQHVAAGAGDSNPQLRIHHEHRLHDVEGPVHRGELAIADCRRAERQHGACVPARGSAIPVEPRPGHQDWRHCRVQGAREGHSDRASRHQEIRRRVS